MAELKPGGLALVYGLKRSTHKNGISVVLIRLLTDEQDEYSNLWWECSGGHGLISPKNLLPINGDDFQHEDEQQKELRHG
ncbi:hypothetical protein [Pantoea allii]|uniref:hypothetical protein n=1 Tax=Pantoea allii TaxID=574096 RepID=UPI0024B674E8|nr:hypothetical protein [Pantoea allii]MDJ0087690.1 hypothetical protein [Pantoea allii]